MINLCMERLGGPQLPLQIVQRLQKVFLGNLIFFAHQLFVEKLGVTKLYGNSTNMTQQSLSLSKISCMGKHKANPGVQLYALQKVKKTNFPKAILYETAFT